MKKAPNSRVNLDRAINRFAGDPARGESLRGTLANAIVAQMLHDGVVKGGSGMKFRYGCQAARATLDLDVARRTDLDTFLGRLRANLAEDGAASGATSSSAVRPRRMAFHSTM